MRLFTVLLLSVMVWFSYSYAQTKRTPVRRGARMAMPAGTVTANVEIEAGSLSSDGQGGYIQDVTVKLNGAQKARKLRISPDGTAFWLDGQTVTPFPALNLFGAGVTQFATRRDAVLVAPGMLNLLIN